MGGDWLKRVNSLLLSVSKRSPEGYWEVLEGFQDGGGLRQSLATLVSSKPS